MKYVLGLDIGIASVGWAVLNMDRQRIEDLGVRMFDRAEVPKTGESLAAPRRLARSLRRRLWRRAERLADAKDLFVAHRLIPETARDSAFETARDKPDPWTLRLEGLDHLLTGEELARALFHIIRRRGFKSNRREVKENDDEGKLKAAVAHTKHLLEEGGYRTVGEMFMRDAQFQERKRNTSGSYTNTVERLLLEDEIHTLFTRQRELGNTATTSELETATLAIFTRQKSYATGDLYLSKVGRCTFEPGEKRAPKNSYTAERFRLFERLNHLRYTVGGTEHKLEKEERETLVERAYTTEKTTYADIRRVVKLPEGARFAGRSYTRRKGEEVGEDFACEKATCISMPGYHALRKALTKVGAWEDAKDNTALLDDLAFALTFYREDTDIRRALEERGVEERFIAAALNAEPMAKVANLSLVAMRKMLPFMEMPPNDDGKWIVYSEAAELAGYDHTATPDGERKVKLPALDADDVRNPVVMRAFAQSRKVVNAVIDRYGAPWRVHVELARDMSRTHDERNKVKKTIEENRAARERERERFQELFPAWQPTAENVMKYRLYIEQNGQSAYPSSASTMELREWLHKYPGKCAYSHQPLDIDRLFEPGYAEIDHVLPWSRSSDDSWANRVLVTGRANREKKNQTPFEWFGHDEARWQYYTAWVHSTIRDTRKRSNLLMEKFSEEREKDWKTRNLNDTRYVSRLFADYVRDTLRFAGAKEKRSVVCTKGQMTAIARRLWGLGKDRSDDLNHAQDAAVVAALTDQQIHRMSVYRKAREEGLVEEGDMWEDPETGEVIAVHDRHFAVPDPWPNFRKELRARLVYGVDEDNNPLDPAVEIAKLNLPGYAVDPPPVRPIFVSRAARRTVSGAIHKETIRSVKRMKKDGVSTVHTALTALTTKDLPDLLALKDDPPLYHAIAKRLAAHGGDGKKAFGNPENPLYKPCHDGKKVPIVRAVQVATKQKSGVPVRKGIADNGSMVRIDIFRKGKKHFLVPVYVSDVMKGVIPIQAIKAFTLEKDWPQIDDTYDFLFSLYPNDLVEATFGDDTVRGYYVSCDRSTASVRIATPNSSLEKDSTRYGLVTADKLTKYQIDILGQSYPVRKEVRLGLARRADRQPGTAAG